MGLVVRLEDEFGKVFEVAIDEQNLLHKLLPSSEDSTAMLAGIDWYGDTTFNRMQISRFLIEWNELLSSVHTPAVKTLLEQIKALAVQCADGVHLHLKFIGD